MTTILSAVSKLRGCVNQIENKNPSCVSEQDILNQAKMLLVQYVKYKRTLNSTSGLCSKAWKNLQITTVMHSKKKVVILHNLHRFQLIPSHHHPLTYEFEES
ncbi:hypothetical protein IGI04_024311 [Brassica rapa subsp. trilocularis]|uniref:Uncharacterized protein n=1 Tax=Brassica rapa subsp. trilocularis TaxID=1813537 RepID=A0ABQ7M8E9_BRACM|nr:hypothetical protein IGI04_024311 [Brassica rapa subsp. trilocularis]